MRLVCAHLLAISIALVGSGPLQAHVQGHALDVLDLPNSATEAMSYEIDLNGDGNAENAFGAVLASIAGSFEIDIAEATQSAVTSGQIVHLVELRSTDATFTNDAAAEANWYVGEATLVPPLCDGTDTFSYDPGFAPGAFVAPLIGGGFVSASPATTNAPGQKTLFGISP